MSYETVTLRDCGPACCRVIPTHSRFTSLGIVPIAALGLKTVGKAVIGKVVSGIFGTDPEKAARTQAARELASLRTPEQRAADFAATMTAFRRQGVGTALDRVMGRATVIGKRPRSANIMPAPIRQQITSTPIVPVDPVVMEPVPARGSQAMMSVPTSMAESGPASGGGAESEAAPSTPSAPASGLAPLLIGGLVLFAFSRRKRQR